MSSIQRVSRVRFPDVLPLERGEALSGLHLEAGYWKYYRVRVPVGQRVLVITATGEKGELDLFIRRGALPGRHGYDFQTGTSNGCRDARVEVESPEAGDWFVGLFSWNYNGVTLTANYAQQPEMGSPPEGADATPLEEALQECCDTVVSPPFSKPHETPTAGNKRGLKAAS